MPISYENHTFSKYQNYNMGPTIKGRWNKFSKNIQVTLNKYEKLCISSCLEIMLMNGLYWFNSIENRSYGFCLNNLIIGTQIN